MASVQRHCPKADAKHCFLFLDKTLINTRITKVKEWQRENVTGAGPTAIAGEDELLPELRLKISMIAKGVKEGLLIFSSAMQGLRKGWFP